MTAERRARVRERLGALDALLVESLVNVRWLTGLGASSASLLVGADGDVLRTDGRYAEQAEALAAAQDGLEVVVDRSDDWLAERVGDHARLGIEDDVATWRRVERLRALLPGARLEPAGGTVQAERLRKDADELELLGRACRITAEVLVAVPEWLRPGLAEREVARRVEDGLRDRGAHDRAFATIVASGPNGARPHHSPAGRVIAEGDLVTVDAGALVGGYHADMTRTYALGACPPRLREAYEAVRTAQQAGLAAVRAGVAAGEVDDAARAVLLDAGLADALRHSTGHGVGLEIHEPPILRSGEAARLPAGAVVTVEPGAYLEGVGGIRIEDTVAVIAAGHEVLTAAPTELLVL